MVELLVVLFIIGLMMGLLLPALQGARNRVHARECENNVRQLALGLSQYIDAKEMLPASGDWTVALLPYIEQRPLADAMKNHADAGGKYPRPALMKCPMQNDFESRLPSIGETTSIVAPLAAVCQRPEMKSACGGTGKVRR